MTVLIDHERPGATAPSSSGLVVRTSPHARGTDVDVAADAGIRTITVSALPDEIAARAALGTMRRATSVRFDLEERRMRCTLRGVGHRTPCELPVSIGAGLALVRAGLVAVVVERESR